MDNSECSRLALQITAAVNIWAGFRLCLAKAISRSRHGALRVSPASHRRILSCRRSVDRRLHVPLSCVKTAKSAELPFASPATRGCRVRQQIGAEASLIFAKMTLLQPFCRLVLYASRVQANSALRTGACGVLNSLEGPLLLAGCDLSRQGPLHGACYASMAQPDTDVCSHCCCTVPCGLLQSIV